MTLPRLVIRHSDGARTAACTQECAHKWMVANALRCPDQRLTTVQWVMRECCQHCGWCGDIVSRPHEPCMRHGHPGVHCPGFDPLASVVTQRAIEKILDRAGVTELPPRGWAYLDEVAEYAHESYRWPDTELLVDGMMDRRMDWRQ